MMFFSARHNSSFFNNAMSVDEEDLGVDHDARSADATGDAAAEPGPEISSDAEKTVDGSAQPKGADEDHEYITGMKLFSVMSSVTLCCFLMLLDTSIITTVRSSLPL